MRSIDPLPNPGIFDRPMYVLAIQTRWNIKFLGNDCPGCLRVWEQRLEKRGWIDLGPRFGISRIAPIQRMWAHYGRFYGKFHPVTVHPGCIPEQIDSYDKDGLLYQHTCKPAEAPSQDNLDQAAEDFFDDDDYYANEEGEGDFDD